MLEIGDSEGNIALHHLCRNPKATVQAVAALSDAYPEGVLAVNAENQTPTDLAIDTNQEVASFLSTAVLKRRKTGGSRPLHQICSDPRVTVQMVKDVLSNSPDEVCVPDDERCLPLHIACRTGASLDVIRFLVEDWPESLRWTSKGGSLPLHMACSNMADVSVVQYLISVFPKATGVANEYGWLPLHCACAYGASSNVISLLVASNDKSSQIATYGQGDYPLHLACCGSASLEIIYWLTEAREEGIKLTNNAGELALHKACFNNAPIEVVQFLVEQYPQSVFVADQYGSTPLQIAELRKNHTLVDWLKSKEV
jgi:ankyrin repeat protein